MAMNEQLRVHNTSLKIIEKATKIEDEGHDLQKVEITISVRELRAMAQAIVELGDENVKLKLKLMENGVNYAD